MALQNGIYRTEAGSIVTVSGDHSGRFAIEFDWLEEGACIDATPMVEEDELHWACDQDCQCSGHATLHPMEGASGIKAPVTPTTYLDEKDAAEVAWAYIEEIAQGLIKPERGEITKGQLHGGGGVIALYYFDALIAQAVIVRNSLNRSILTCHDYRQPFPKRRVATTEAP